MLVKGRKDLAKDTDGQVLIMAAFFSLFLAAAAASVIPLGQTVTGKIQAQNAADSAAMASSTWRARGSNLLQQSNGLHWDMNVALADVVCVSAAVAATEIGIAMLDPLAWPEIPAMYEKERNFLNKMDKVHSSSNKVVSCFQTAVSKGMPYIAFFHANFLAEKNGADHLDLRGIPLIKNLDFLKKIHIPSVVESVVPYFWTVGSETKFLNPFTAFQFGEEKTESGHKTAFCMTEVNPFVGCLFFGKSLNWKDPYYESVEGFDRPVSFIVTRKPRRSFVLDKLLSQKGDGDLVPGICAFSATRITGDKLYPSGMKDMKYKSLPSFVFAWPLPFQRVISGIVGKSGYEGKFKPELVPVEFAGGVKGKNLFVVH